MNSSTPSPAISVNWEGETIIISNVERNLPALSTGDDRAEVVAAGASNPATPLPADAWHAVARALVTPAAVAAQLRQSKNAPGGLLQEEHVEGATLRSVLSRAWLLELFPGIQPRTGMEVMETSDPRVEGVTESGHPSTLLRYTYKTLEDLKSHVWQTIQNTLILNNYTPSILSRKVTRALITHPVEFAFEDGTESIYALVVRDGITRLASAWKVLAGPGASVDDAATAAVDALFGTVSAKNAGDKPLTQRMAASREARRRALATEFANDWVGVQPGVRAIQVAQTCAVPVQITVGVQRHMSGPALAAEDLFDDAMRSILASVHLEFKEWDPFAQNVEVATRALKRVIQLGLGGWDKDDLQVVYGLAVGRTPVEDLSKEYGNNKIPGTALWRAVYLVHALTHQGLYEPLKEQSKAIKGERRMSEKGFGGLLAPIVDLPWRSTKRDVIKQARNAWANGGVLAKDLLASVWEPVPTTDFTTLVEPARQGDENARFTLAVAGGTALIADKLLTRNVGSALMAPKDKGGVPFRADVNDIVGDLAQADNELGLWTLALAAQRFEAGRLPQNSATTRQLTRKQGTAAEPNDYVHVLVDLQASDRVARDAAGKPIPLTQWDVVWASDEPRANKEMARRARSSSPVPLSPAPAISSQQPTAAEPGKEENSEEGTPTQGEIAAESSAPRPLAQRAADERRVLKDSLGDARHALDELIKLESEHTGWPPLFTLDDLKPMHAVAQDIKHELYQRLKAAEERQRQEDEAALEEDANDGNEDS
ncbi:hypothetical protein ACFCYB_14945 [Streptomyces sp. NPDC056309]|uniref:hypothetical protein n=1 Tax=unclassified Streptomyces TaxID=2593676 RepID=UPI0035D7984F